jgi:GT2 family glycosyltransferase
MGERFRLDLEHVWQEDQGFRKCRVLNRAIERTSADYLIFSDGDCIPRRDFVATHYRYARPGVLLSGGCVRLDAQASARLTIDDVLAGRATDPSWLHSAGTRLGRKRLKLLRSHAAARLLDRITPTKATWNGQNSSTWREAIVRVNGFDERMGYWAEDREMGVRLLNSGMRAVQLRYSAVLAHLEHDRPYRDAAIKAQNRALLERTRRERRTWTNYGIVRTGLDALVSTGAEA